MIPEKMLVAPIVGKRVRLKDGRTAVVDSTTDIFLRVELHVTVEQASAELLKGRVDAKDCELIGEPS